MAKSFFAYRKYPPPYQPIKGKYNIKCEFLWHENTSSNAARRYDDGCHVSRPRCLLQALSWLRMPMRLLQVRPQCRHM